MRNPGAKICATLTVCCVFSTVVPIVAQPQNEEEGLPAIREGTKLAELIKEVQPHKALFAPAEKAAPFASELPDWLRAHYRRNHPTMRKTVRPLDPTFGYPLALENLYIWMLYHQDLQPSAPPPAALPFRIAGVGNNVRISGVPVAKSPKSESDIRVNPKDSTQIVAGSNNIRVGLQAQFFSSDGGATWGQTTLPLVTGDSTHSDPTVDWTSDGTAWATTIGISAGSAVLQLRAYNSHDGGQTWVFDGTISGNQTDTDKQMMCVDRGAASPFRDTIYVIWHTDSAVFVNRRTAAGWDAPLQVSGAETTGNGIGGDITTNSAGDVFAFWPDPGSQGVFVAKSVNGGQAFAAPAKIATTFDSFDITVPSFANRHALIYASGAAFKDGGTDAVYAAWTDLSGEPGCVSAASQPGKVVGSPCKSRVWFAKSMNGGPWQAAIVNPDASRSDQFNQRLAIDPSTGILGIVYYDTSADAGRLKTNLVFQSSADSGANWSTPLIVSSAMTDETNNTADRLNQYGDYNGLSVTGDGAFYPSWTDHRDNNPEAIFTARITVTKDAAGRAVPALASAGNARSIR
jgi:hypothetical protein